MGDRLTTINVAMGEEVKNAQNMAAFTIENTLSFFRSTSDSSIVFRSTLVQHRGPLQYGWRPCVRSCRGRFLAYQRTVGLIGSVCTTGFL